MLITYTGVLVFIKYLHDSENRTNSLILRMKAYDKVHQTETEIFNT